MLICGETILKPRLAGSAYLIYWLICFVLTFVAIIVAFRDFRALRLRIRDEHRDLIEGTLDRIHSDAKEKKSPKKPLNR
jgi:hypothetical protein